MDDPPPIAYSQAGRRARRPVISHLMAEALSKPGLLSLAAGFTDNAALPGSLVPELVREVAAGQADNAWLQYGTSQGRPGLRAATLEWLARYPGETPGTESGSVLITNGSQQALHLAARSLCDAGDIVLVQAPSYFVFLELLRGLGIEAVPMPEDARGRFDLDALGTTLTTLRKMGMLRRLKAVYLVSYYANPSARCLPLAEKERLARFLTEQGLRLPVIEDGAYRDLYFDKPWPGPGILAIPAFESFPRLYLGTYTKPFATGLKVGFAICDHPGWREKMLALKGHEDFGTANAMQCIIERLLVTGRYAPFLDGTRPHYAAKAARMDAALRAAGLAEAGWHWEMPGGGLLFWLHGPEGLDTSPEGPLWEAAMAHQVLYVPGSLCFAGNGPRNCVRLSFGAIADERLSEAVERFAAAARQAARPSPQ